MKDEALNQPRHTENSSSLAVDQNGSVMILKSPTNYFQIRLKHYHLKFGTHPTLMAKVQKAEAFTRVLKPLRWLARNTDGILHHESSI